MKTVNNVTYIPVENLLDEGYIVWAVESDPERDAFEDACLIQFAKWRAAGNEKNDNGCPTTKDALCWRTGDGEYGVEALNGAWWGWQQGRAWRG